jgi:hypothetical protein
VRVGQSVGQQLRMVSNDAWPVDEVARDWVCGRNDVMLVASSLYFGAEE